MSIGAGLALGGGSPALFRTIADSPAEADYMIFKHEAAERERRKGR